MFMKAENKALLLPTIKLAIQNFFKHGADKEAAALAYFLLFAIFPMSIFISNLIGLLELDIVEITMTLKHLLPGAMIQIVEGYLEYVTNSASTSLFLFSLVFSIWFPMRAVKVLMDNVHKAYQLGKPHSAKTYLLRQFVFTALLLLSIFLMLFVLTLGERVVLEIVAFLSNDTWKISQYVLSIWQYSRFVLVGLLMLFILTSLYVFSLERKQPLRYVLPGIFVSLILWLIVSLVFSFYVENFANYSLLYGTLGTVIVAMIWLYLTAMVLLLGLEFNGALVHLKAIKQEENNFRRVIE